MELREIRIKRDGKWYANDVEMFRTNILNIFVNNMERDGNGQYYIAMNQETFPLVVEDVPFMAVKAFVYEGSILFKLHDEQELIIDSVTPIHFEGDTPYLTLRWENDTRINRSAFWMVANFLREKGDRIYLVPPKLEG